MNRYLLIRRLYGPAYLLLVGVIALLAEMHILSWGRSWPLFILLAGVLKLAEFIVLRSEGYPPPPAGWQPGQPWTGQQPYQGQPYAGQPYPGGYPPYPPASTPQPTGSSIVPVDPTQEEKK